MAKCLLMLLTRICTRVLQQMHVSDTSLQLAASYFSLGKHLLDASRLVHQPELRRIEDKCQYWSDLIDPLFKYSDIQSIRARCFMII